MRRLFIPLGLIIAQPLFADSNLPPAYWSDRQLPDPRQEAQAQALMEQLRCLVCQGRVDRQFRCRACRRHARPRAAPDCRWRKAAGGPRLAGPALRYMDQLQADFRTRSMAFMACAARAAGRWRVADPQAHQGEELLMGWLILVLIIALSLGALRVLQVRGAAFTASAAALLLGGAGYALQAVRACRVCRRGDLTAVMPSR